MIITVMYVTGKNKRTGQDYESAHLFDDGELFNALGKLVDCPCESGCHLQFICGRKVRRQCLEF